MTENLKFWLAFSKIDGVGSIGLTDIYKHFGCMKEAWNASFLDWMSFSRLQKGTIEKFIEKRKKINPDQLEEEICSKEIQVITIQDDNYPELLREIYDPPGILFIKGDLNSCNLKHTLAIVGSRKCSLYIKDVINSLVAEMHGTDITIVSGMAAGVDTIAHKAAIKEGLKTIAVLGSGFDNIYPKSNVSLFKEITEGNGAVISEYYPSIEPLAFRFPRRNRIVSGLSKGTLIAEASLKSGALITARLCLEQNRELMCIPGMVNNPNTAGTHQLLKNGAGLVTSFEDILNHMNWEYKGNSTEVNNSNKIELLDNELKVYEIVSLDPTPIDKIVNNSTLNIGEIMVALTSLELKGLIHQIPGENYVRSVR